MRSMGLCVVWSASPSANLLKIRQIRRMKIIFPSFAIFLVAAVLLAPQVVEAQSTAASTAAAAPDEKANAELLVQQMVAALAADKSISARIRLHVDLFGNQMVGAGLYLQQGLAAERQLRLEIKIPVGERLATLQQVCDGNFLWQFHDLSDKPALTRVDIRRVQEAAARAGHKPVPDLLGGSTFGGLPQLVDSLGQSFRFTRAQAEQLDTVPVWIVFGTWKPEVLAPISPDLAKQATEGKPLDLKKLPPQMPEEVVLYLGQDDLFPYRIEYRRRPTKQGRGAGDVAREAMPILTVELYEVRLNSPIDARQFAYQPGSLEVLDTTDHVLKSLK